MAVCEIWDVKGRLDHPIDYAENPEKTANPKYSESDLQAVFRYGRQLRPCHGEG